MNNKLNMNSWSEYLGTVVVGNEPDDRYIEVFCPELLPLVKGEVTSNREEITTTVIGTDEIPQVSRKINVGLTLRCEYIGNGGDVSIPDVVSGERVLIRRMDGDDRYFWQPYRYNNIRRTTEHRAFRIMDKEHNQEPTNEDETYVVEFDSRIGKKIRGIRLHTGNGSNEQFRYTVHIDTENNQIIIEDDAQNIIHLRSTQKQIELKNTTGSYVFIDDRDVKVHAVRDVSVTADRDITATATRDINAIANNNVNIHAKRNLMFSADNTSMGTTKGQFEWVAGGPITYKAPVIKLQAPKVTIDASITNIIGNVTIGGTLKVNGYSTFNGGTGLD